MICRIGAVVRTGPAITVEQPVEAKRVFAAIKQRTQTDCEATRSVVLDCEPPTAVHDHVGHIHPEMELRPRTALAAAGRSRGLETPHDDEIEGIEEELESVSVEETDLQAHRREQADEREELRKIQEAVATTRGRLAACRERGLETDELETRLEEQIRQLAQVQTTATAATQSHERARERAQAHRDRRERQLRLEDRLANRRRDARRWLVEELEDEFAETLRALSGGPVDDPFDCRPPVAGLAIAEIAEYTAPIVLETDHFESATAAREFLGGPVVRV